MRRLMCNHSGCVAFVNLLHHCELKTVIRTVGNSLRNLLHPPPGVPRVAIQRHATREVDIVKKEAFSDQVYLNIT